MATSVSSSAISHGEVSWKNETTAMPSTAVKTIAMRICLRIHRKMTPTDHMPTHAAAKITSGDARPWESATKLTAPMAHRMPGIRKPLLRKK